MTILIADDRPINLKLLRAVLEAENHTVLEAADGTEALAILGGHSVDAIVSDILMPHMDGYRLCFEVRQSQEWQAIPFIFYTATYTSPADEKLCYDLGADNYLRKPATAELIVQALHSALHSPGRRMLKPFNESQVMKEYNERLVLKLEEKSNEATAALEKLQASETNYRRLFEAAKDGIVILDAETGKIEDINPYLIETLGYPKSDFLGKQLWEIGAFQDIIANKANFAVLQKERYIRYDDLPLRTSSGGHLIVEFVSNAYEVNGRQIIQCNIRDITERRSIEARLRLKGRALAATANAILIAQKDGTIEWINAAFSKMTGYSLAEAIGKQPGTLLKSGTHDRIFYQNLWQTIQAGKIWHGEIVNRRKDGTLYPEEMTITPVTGADGEITHFIAVKLDISGRKNADDQLRESELRFRQIAENIREIFFLTDLQISTVFYISPAYEAIWGRTCASLYANPNTWAEAIHPDDKARVFAELVPQGTLVRSNSEFRIVRPNGQIRSIRVRTFPIANEAGETYRFAGIAEDITEQKSFEAQLRQSQKMEAIGQLSGGVAHDFNNLLTVIMGHIDVLSDFCHDDNAIESITEIRRAAERAANLTKQLLMFARKQTMQLRNLDINSVVTDTIKMLTRILGEDIQLDFHPASGELMVNADAGMLDQILMNLAVNARDAMPKGGRLIIETGKMEFDDITTANTPQVRPGTFAVISVTDSGTGIPAHLLPKIFEPFFTTKDVDKGTGLGLATVFGLAQQHGGWVSAYSEEGQGAVFRVYIPIVKGSLHSEATQQASATASGGNETILLVEDEPSIRLLLSKYLTQLGYTVITAANGQEGIKSFAEHREDISLLLTEMVMPGQMTGLELAATLRAQKPGLRVVYSSGYSDKHVSGDLVLTEGVNFLSKPFNLLDVTQIIRGQLDSVDK